MNMLDLSHTGSLGFTRNPRSSSKAALIVFAALAGTSVLLFLCGGSSLLHGGGTVNSNHDEVQGRSSTALAGTATALSLGSKSNLRSMNDLVNAESGLFSRSLKGLGGYLDPKSLAMREVGGDAVTGVVTADSGSGSLSCVHRRGQSGKWVPSVGYNYAGTDGPHDPQTRWTWEDDATNCPLQKLRADGMCRAMKRLGYRRILFLGDSLAHEFSSSFFMLLTQTSDDHINNISEMMGEHPTFECPNFSFEIKFLRNDFLHDVQEFTKIDKHKLYPWLEDYMNFPEPQILVASMGLHSPDEEAYVRDLHSFFDKLQRVQDMVVWRTSAPGHVECENYFAPLNSPGEAKMPSRYNWLNIPGYNDYTRDVVRQKQEEDGEDRWMFLDILPMTVLRPDGHRAPPVDCLHYLLPGPTDYWAHLLYSNLLSMAQI